MKKSRNHKEYIKYPNLNEQNMTPGTRGSEASLTTQAKLQEIVSKSNEQYSRINFQQQIIGHSTQQFNPIVMFQPPVQHKSYRGLMCIIFSQICLMVFCLCIVWNISTLVAQRKGFLDINLTLLGIGPRR